jgi:tetratricopeptide (TPR) repeat protein
LKKNDESLKCFEKALNLYEKQCGIHSKETALCLEDMADLHCKRSEKAEAEFLFKWALQILAAVTAEGSDPEAENQTKRINTKLESIGELCVPVLLESDFSAEEKQLFGAQQKKESAKSKLDDTALEEEMLSPVDVPAYLWHQYASTAQKARQSGDLLQAERMYARALQKANEFGYQDSRLWQTLSEFASVYAEQGKFVRAESLYQSAQQYCEKTLGNLHQRNTTYWEHLAKLYEKQEDRAKAAMCFDKIVTIMAKNNRPLVEYANYLKKLERLQSKTAAEFFD